MLTRIYGTLIKELLILWRDKAGLAVLFLMPVALIIIMVVIQDRTFHFLQDVKIPVLLLDEDKQTVGKSLTRLLNASGQVVPQSKISEKELDLSSLKRQVAEGNFNAGIYIPTGVTERTENQVKNQTSQEVQSASDSIQVFFDPAINQNMKLLIESILRESLARIEVRFLYQHIKKELSMFGPQATALVQMPDSSAMQKNKIEFKSVALSRENYIVLPNSVQHNVPAWSLFAMFFIVIPLATSMIQERSEGNLKRLLSTPLKYSELILGKVVVYLTVCLAQFALMVACGIYLLPELGFATLQIGNQPLSIFIVTYIVSLAASGYGILVGTFASSQQQASSFGAISIIIAAAIGGIWVPVFIMPEFMQLLSQLSPLAWGLNAFHELFLRGGTVIKVWKEILLLFLFFVFTMSLAIVKFRFTKQ